MSLERDEMFTMAPPPAVSTIFGTTSRESRKALVTLKRSAVSKKRSLVWSAARGSVPPALFTSTSRRPNASTVACTSALQVLGLHDVGAHRERPSPAPSHLVGDGVDVRLRPRRAHDVGARFGERERDAAADALAGAGDDRDAVRELEEVEDHAPPPFRRSVAARPLTSGRSR